MNIFNKTFWKNTHFLHQNYTKWSILKFKFHNSKISLALLRRFLAVQTEILVPVAWLRNLEVSKRPWRDYVMLTSLYDPNFKWRRYPLSPQWRLVIFTVRPLKTCLQTINCLFIASKTVCYVSNTCTCFKTSKRGISVICWYHGRQIKLASTEFSPDYCNWNNSLSISNSIWENYPAGLPQHLHIVHFEIWLIQSNRGIIYHTINRFM